MDVIPIYKSLLAHNGQRYDSVCGNGVPTVMARVFAWYFSKRQGSCHIVDGFY